MAPILSVAFHFSINMFAVQFWWGDMKQRDEVCLKETRQKRVGWMHLAQDRNKWWTSVNTAINLRVS
jgi:hypothetical protein